MVSEEEFHERWGFLRPWCAPVSSMESYYWEDQIDGQPRDFVIRVFEPRGSAAASSNSMRAIRDALVLLTLLLRVDPFAWFGVLAIYCKLGGISHPIDYSFDCHRVRFQLVVVNATPSGWSKATLPDFFSAMDSEPSREFVETVDKILGQQSSIRAPSGELEVRVGVDIKAEIYVNRWTGFVETNVRILRSLCAKYGGWRFPVHANAPVSSVGAGDLASNAPITCVLVVELVSLRLRANVPVSQWVTRILDGVAAEPVGPAIDEVKISLGHSRAMTNVDEVLDEGRLFQRLLCCASDKYARMSFVFEEGREIHQVCIALAQTQSTDSIVISRSSLRRSTESEESRRWVWLAVAYAFLSKLALAQSSVSKVTLSNWQ